jgi:hypothetical protein
MPQHRAFPPSPAGGGRRHPTSSPPPLVLVEPGAPVQLWIRGRRGPDGPTIPTGFNFSSKTEQPIVFLMGRNDPRAVGVKIMRRGTVLYDGPARLP